MEGPEQRLGVACPNRGNFYVCEDKPARFVGCCTINPCDTKNGDCPREKLQTATFNKTAYDKILPQGCMGSDNNTLWYACAYSMPPFMGCCAENPCRAAGCSPDALRPALLSNNKEAAAAFLPMPDSSTQLSASTSKAESTSFSLAETSTRAVTATPVLTSFPGGGATEVHTGSHAEVSKGAVAGIAVGSTAGAILLLGLLVFWFKRALRLRRQRTQAGFERHIDGLQPCHQEQNFAPGPHSIMLPLQGVMPYCEMRSPVYSPSAGYHVSPLGCSRCQATLTPTHCIHIPPLAVELPASTYEVKEAVSGATVLQESPCLGREKMDEASGMTAPSQTRQSRPFELEEPSTQHPNSKRILGEE
ncbi:hypothetical protein TOPH_08136 [Tolypocladium ophioglossoides CBS 100239]|uniref:Uncharacterized protein n=1 Tax=Tolypocladium ophioglossoides (strain CBS 100239) TaxID=1163406 RepID=A0A0L0MZJ8_TOLOC|nr:hypothetical protein TOPH_08136 [Tolypocladium ophioglossoides CBS 100239]